MFNVTIIKLRDIFKMAIILIFIYVFSKIALKDINIKKYLDISMISNTNEFLTLCINSESNIIKDISETDKHEEKTEDMEESTIPTSIESILKIGSNMFNSKEIEKEVGQDNSTIVEENASVEEDVKTEEVKDAPTQVITQNPIAENYNREYNGVKIKNETSYELTDEMLNFNDININNKNIIIFHTHTCESYTESENYKYTPSR